MITVLCIALFAVLCVLMQMEEFRAQKESAKRLHDEGIRKQINDQTENAKNLLRESSRELDDARTTGDSDMVLAAYLRILPAVELRTRRKRWK